MVYAPPRPRRRQLTAQQLDATRRRKRVAITARIAAAAARAREAQPR